MKEVGQVHGDDKANGNSNPPILDRHQAANDQGRNHHQGMSFPLLGFALHTTNQSSSISLLSSKVDLSFMDTATTYQSWSPLFHCLHLSINLPKPGPSSLSMSSTCPDYARWNEHNSWPSYSRTSGCHYAPHHLHDLWPSFSHTLGCHYAWQ